MTKIALGLVLAGAPLVASCADQVAQAKPNVVLIVIDTLRPDHLGAYGYEHETSPFLSELSAHGVVFDRAWSTSSWTAPATASLFTSLYPPQHGVTEGFFRHTNRLAGETDPVTETVSLNRLPAEVTTLPEHFAKAGWSTFALTANVNVTEDIGFDRGFDKFRDFTGPRYGKGGSAETLLDRLGRWKAELQAARPYFLYLHFNDVHEPRSEHGAGAPEARDEVSAERELYEREIRYVDETLRRAYDEFDWAEDTLVCVVSDHGEEFMEHGEVGHKYSLHGELTRVVFLLSWPRRWPAPRRIEHNVGLIDVYPTLAEAAGAPAPRAVEGRSLVGMIEHEAVDSERVLFAHRFGPRFDRNLWSVLKGDWKLIEQGGHIALYDVARDPQEQTDRSKERPEVVAELRHLLEGFRARAVRVGNDSVELTLDQAELEALKALGYTDDGED